MQNIGFYGYDGTQKNGESLTENLIAACLWYCMEGFLHRRKEVHFEKYIKYHAVLEGHTNSISFYKEPAGEKWWMKIKEDAPTTWYNLLPCTEKDYQKTVAGEVPYRWLILQKNSRHTNKNVKKRTLKPIMTC